MDISVEFLIRAGQAETADAVRDHAARKLHFALRRFHGRIRRVAVRVVDVNGPRGGVDSRCSLTVDLADGPRLFVDATAELPFAAITDATSRLAEVVRRAHNRQIGRRVDASARRTRGLALQSERPFHAETPA